MKRLIATAAALAWAGMAGAMTLPWYVNPTRTARLGEGVTTYRSETLRFKSAATDEIQLDSSGAVGWSATGGSLQRWTVSGATATGSPTFTRDAGTTLATGLDEIADFALYAIGGVDYAVVGGGAAVSLVKLSDGTQTALLTGLASDVVSVRMSHADEFRPRLYVLDAAGDLAVHLFAADELAIDGTWTKTVTAAELAALAGGTPAAFDVTADGSALVLARTGAASAVVRHEPKVWCYFTEDGTSYITDGNWKLRCWDEWGRVCIGSGWDTENAYANDYIGEYLDFSAGYATNATTGATMDIDGHRNNSLGVTANGGPRVIVFSPKARVVGYYNQFMKGWDTVEETLVTGSGMDTIAAWTGVASALRRLEMDLPALTTLEGYALCGDNSCADTDADGWNLPALESIGESNFVNFSFRGRLDLPAVKTIAKNVLKECHFLTEVRLGAAAKSVQSIGENVLSVTDKGGDRATGRLAKLVIGGEAGFTIAAGAFGGQPLREVVFTGGVPSFADGFAFPDTAARTVFFAVPKGDAAWTAALADKVTELSDEERLAVKAANPGRPTPFGTVATSVFRTANEQYVCWADETATAGRCKVTLDRDDFFGDTVEVTSDAAPFADGSYAVGTTLTLTPKASASGTFVKWYGDVPGGATNAVPLALVLTGDTWVFARFTHPWTIAKTDDAKKVLVSNGNFTLNCRVKGDGSERALGLGDGTVNDGVRTLYADTDEGAGVLDLGGEIRLAGDDTPWKFTTWEGWAWNGSPLTRTKGGKGDVSTLVITDDMGIPGGGTPFGVDGAGEPSFKTIVIDMPTKAHSLRHWIWGGSQTKLTRLVLQAPNISFEKLNDESEAVFRGEPLAETKFDWWDLSGLTSLNGNAWWVSDNSHVSASGTLRLPSLGTVRGTSLGCLPNVEAIALGGLTKKAFVTAIEGAAFAQDPKLKKLTVYNAVDMTVGEKPFDGGATPGEIVLTGPAILDGGAAFANLLAGVEAAETKPVVICVSGLMWSGTPYIDTAVSDAERAQLPGEDVLGVYRGGAEAPLGKALVVKRASPYEPRGGIWILR